MITKVVYVIFFNLLISLVYNQNTSLGIHADPGDDLIRVINLSEKL